MIAPTNKQMKPAGTRKAASGQGKRLWLYLTALGLIAVGAAVSCCLLNRPSAEAPAKAETRKNTIPVNKPAKPEAGAKAEFEPVKKKWTKETDRVHRDGNKRVVHDPDAPLGSKANPINIDAMTFPDNPIQPKRKLFGTHAENYICGLMRTKPGTRIIPTRLPANFDEEFKAHIADPVRIEDGDSEEDIALKEQMHEFKKEAARLIGEGMTPTEIILQERKELNRIADHRAVCAAEIGRLKREGASEQEIEDCINAANSIMEQYGARKFMTTAQIKQMLFEKNQK